MEVVNELKAMGLELPATTPPPGRAAAVKVCNIPFVGGHTPGQMHRGKMGSLRASSKSGPRTGWRRLHISPAAR